MEEKLEGLQARYYANGQKSSEQMFKDGEMNGPGTAWYENGQKREEWNFKDGQPHGLQTAWHKNGQKGSEGTFKDGKEEGLHTEWDQNGHLIKSVAYKNGAAVKATSLVFFVDNQVGCQSSLKMSDDNPCTVALAKAGIVVKKSKRGFWGAILFEEKNTSKAVTVTNALAYLYPDKHPSITSHMTNPVLRVVTNAILHCESIEEVSRVLNNAVQRAEKKSGTTIDEIVGIPI